MFYRFLIITALLASLNAQRIKYGSVKDIDGNIYKTVVIGRYEWMAENLKTTRYNDGSEIPNITSDSLWINLKSGAYCWYNNNKSEAGNYGALYNWYAVNTDKLAPAGWRVPSDDEWKYLEGSVDSLYGIDSKIWNKTGGRGSTAGKCLKALYGWDSNGGGNDNLGFFAFPAGERVSNGSFFLRGKSAFWWSSTQSDSLTALYRNIIYGDNDINRYSHPKIIGFSVRCIRDLKN